MAPLPGLFIMFSATGRDRLGGQRMVKKESWTLSTSSFNFVTETRGEFSRLAFRGIDQTLQRRRCDGVIDAAA